MLEYYSLLIATCDDKGSSKCMEEAIVKVEEGEKKSEAIKLLKANGWIIEGGLVCKCPQCNRSNVVKLVKRTKK